MVAEAPVRHRKLIDFVNAIPGLRAVAWPTAISTNGRSGAKPPTDLNMIEGKAMSFLMRNVLTKRLALVDADVSKGDAAAVRIHAEEARKAFEEQVRDAPQEPGGHVGLGLALAYLGRREEAFQEGERGGAISPISRDAVSGPC